MNTHIRSRRIDSAIADGAEIPGRKAPRRSALALIIVIVLVSFSARVWDLGGSGLQNDEQLWHDRSTRFVQSLLGPFGPSEFNLPKVYWRNAFVDLSAEPLALKFYPFTAQIQAPHPGAPMGFLIGTSAMLLADGMSNWSLDTLSLIAAARIPAILLGTILTALIFFWGRHLVGTQAALFAAALMAVEPIMVGFSRLARLDISQALWCFAAVLAYVTALKTRSGSRAVLAGLFMALGLTTNPYALFIAPTLLAARFLFSPDPFRSTVQAHGWRLWHYPTRLDWLLVGSVFLFFILFYPNIWANPFIGVKEIIVKVIATPHARGELPGSTMPVSHWFYVLRAPEHLLPWTLALAAFGALAGLRRHPRTVLMLFVWIASVLLLLSLPSGRKFFRNILILLPPLLLLAGLGLDTIVRAVMRLIPDKAPVRAVLPLTLTAVLLAGAVTTIQWWPYPQLYTWPWRGDPQLAKVKELVAEGEGVREAIAHIRKVGPEKARVGMFTGQNNARYYYSHDLTFAANHPDDLAKLDWLVVLPKLSFGSPPSHALVKWVKDNPPTMVIRQHQVEMVRVYDLRRMRAGNNPGQ